VLNVIEGALASSMDHDELASDAEVSVVGEFLQTIRDWGDLYAEMEPADRVQVAFDLTKALTSLDELGLWAFGGREVRILEGADQGPCD
jgi:hypothetical protein